MTKTKTIRQMRPTFDAYLAQNRVDTQVIRDLLGIAA